MKSKKSLPIARPAPIDLAGVFHAERLTVFEELAPRSLDTVKDVVENAHSFGERLARDGAPLACKEGCAHCCHIPVTASAAEIFAIVDRLSQTLSAEALATLATQMEEYVRSTVGKSNDEAFRERARCPLLDEQGACTVYDIRPLPCRGWNALDARECEQAYLTRDPDVPIRIDGTRRAIMVHVETGLRFGAADLGLDGRPLRLVAGILAALREPTLLDGWLDGGIFPDSAIDTEVLEMEAELRATAGSVEDSRAWHRAHFPREREARR